MNIQIIATYYSDKEQAIKECKRKNSETKDAFSVLDFKNGFWLLAVGS